MTSWKILSGLQFYYCEQLTPDEIGLFHNNEKIFHFLFYDRNPPLPWGSLIHYSGLGDLDSLSGLYVLIEVRLIFLYKNYFRRHDPMCFRRHLEIFGYFACQLSVNPPRFSPHFCGLVNFNFTKEAKKLQLLKPPTLSFFFPAAAFKIWYICWILFVVSQIVS